MNIRIDAQALSWANYIPFHYTFLGLLAKIKCNIPFHLFIYIFRIKRLTMDLLLNMCNKIIITSICLLGRLIVTSFIKKSTGSLDYMYKMEISFLIS